MMKPTLLHPLLLLPAFWLLLLTPQASAQTTAFTYQGHLMDNGASANGNYDMQFTLKNALTEGITVGTPQAVPSVNAVKYVRATSSSGAAWNAPLVLDSTGVVGAYTSLAVVNGNPAISYYDETNGALKYVRATDVSGTAWGTPITIDNAAAVGEHTSLAVIGGKPAITYYDRTNGDLNYVLATDASGTAWNAPLVIDGAGGDYTSLVEHNGNAAVSYRDAGNRRLKFAAGAQNYQINWIALPP